MEKREAKKLGLFSYNTGRPCIHGHFSDRYTSNGRCIECRVEYVERNREQLNERQRNYYRDEYQTDEEFRQVALERQYESNKTERRKKYMREYMRKYYAENREKMCEYSRSWKKGKKITTNKPGRPRIKEEK